MITEGIMDPKGIAGLAMSDIVAPPTSWIASLLGAYADLDLAYAFDTAAPIAEFNGGSPSLAAVGTPTLESGLEGVGDFVTTYDGGASYNTATMPGGTDATFTAFFLFRAGVDTTQMLAGCGGGTNDYFLLYIVGGYLKIRSFANASIRDSPTSPDLVNDGNWHIGCFRYDYATDLGSMFIDGSGPYDVASLNSSHTPNRDWRFGDGIAATSGWKGSIAAMLWSNSAMSDADCAAITAQFSDFA